MVGKVYFLYIAQDCQVIRELKGRWGIYGIQHPGGPDHRPPGMLGSTRQALGRRLKQEMEQEGQENE